MKIAVLKRFQNTFDFEIYVHRSARKKIYIQNRKNINY